MQHWIVGPLELWGWHTILHTGTYAKHLWDNREVVVPDTEFVENFGVIVTYPISLNYNAT